MSRPRGTKTGIYRSKLEASVAARLKRLKIPFGYEEQSYDYILSKTYTPDFFFSNGRIFEVKGVLMQDDREKMIAVRKAHPDLKIILVFAKPHRKCPGLKSTHAEWAIRHGYEWLDAATFKTKDVK